MGDYGGVRSQVAAFLHPQDTTSASDSDVSGPPKVKSNPRGYRLYSNEVKEGVTVHDAIDCLGESYTSGKISRFEFENRTALIAHFTKFKSPSDMPFIVEEPEIPESESCMEHLRIR